MENNKILIYSTPEGNTNVSVTVENDTVWLSQQQMAELFGTQKAAISKHISNIYMSGELQKEATVSKMETVKREGHRNVTRKIEYYNLDMIISVGYRVNSIRGTQFRIWANKVLKDYLVKGYAVNNKITARRYDELKQLVAVIGRTATQERLLSRDEALSLINMVSDYTYALDTLDRYDYQQLTVNSTTKEEKFHANYDNAMEMIDRLREKFGGGNLFGNEKDDSFKSSIGQIYQTFGGIDLYPSVEEKAAMLLYLVTKNHSFSDGNKRIADNALVALTLMIAESRTEEKDTMVKVIVNLINKDNK